MNNKKGAKSFVWPQKNLNSDQHNYYVEFQRILA